MSELIAELKRIANEKAEELRVAQEKLHTAKVEASGMKIGDIVFSKGKEYRVIKIDARGDDKPWLYGNVRKADGTFGTGRRALYSYWTKR